jgi:hypothetical protein
MDMRRGGGHTWKVTQLFQNIVKAERWLENDVESDWVQQHKGGGVCWGEGLMETKPERGYGFLGGGRFLEEKGNREGHGESSI